MEIYNKSDSKELRKYFRANVSKAEQLLWAKLKAKRFCDVKFRRQYGVDKYILDFYSVELRLAIEIDGGTHFEKEEIEYDEKRTKFLNSIRIKVIRFTNNDVYKNILNVLEEIKKEIELIKT